MKYLITLESSQEVSNALQRNPKQTAKEMKEFFAQYKPEAAYFSTTRRHGIFVVEVKDAHVELRRIFEAMSKYGQVTVDPVSNVEEFFHWVESLQEQK